MAGVGPQGAPGPGGGGSSGGNPGGGAGGVGATARGFAPPASISTPGRSTYDPRKKKRVFGPGNTNPNLVSAPSFSRGALPSQGVGDGSLPDPLAPPPQAEPAAAASASPSAKRDAEERRRRRAVGRNAVTSTQSTTGGFSAAKTLLGQ
jgi:hypothetical protein